MVDSNRYFKNGLPDSAASASLLDSATGTLEGGCAERVARIFSRLYAIFDKNKESSHRDNSVYTGSSGIAYLYLLLSDADPRSPFFKEGMQLAEASLKGLRVRDVTFLCGEVGPLALASVFYHLSNRHQDSLQCVSTVLRFLPSVTNLSSDLPNELLYGRIGYLFTLLFIKKYIPTSVSAENLKQVANAVITAGKVSRRAGDEPPLMWHWHGKRYLGAPHGLSGILYLLLQVREVLTEEQLSDIKKTADYLLTLRFPSGNFPSSLSSSDDRLVHWCHGAPGWVQFLLAAYEVWRDEKFLDAALTCGEVVWARGLLRKGYGICHGVAGNAYTFLALYQATREDVHLHRAVQFALWCETYPNNQDHPPDRPYSLFEGLAGTLYFLKDIQKPVSAIFPAYSPSPFSPLT